MRHKLWIIIAITVIATIIIGWKITHRQPKMVYTSEGFGGFKVAEAPKKKTDIDILADKYNKGDYKAAEKNALQVINKYSASSEISEKRKAVKARYYYAFAAARQKDLKTASVRFTQLNQEALKLPDKGKSDAPVFMNEPNLAEEGAYQHAVCAAALGDKEKANAEYLQFIKDNPRSPLMNGVVMRLEKLNNGKLPKDASDAWFKAQKIASAQRKKEEMEQSMCGPECIAELLKRDGKEVNVNQLAKEMKTDNMGTSMQAMADILKKYGYKPKGLQLTRKGLSQQKMPVITLIMRHFVIIESANILGVNIWDPSSSEINKPQNQHFSNKAWEEIWSGAVITAER